MALSIIYDTAQKRVRYDALRAVAAGSDFQTGIYYQNVILDTVTKTLMLAPSIFHPDWYTEKTGDYAKLGLSAFGLASDPAWEERESQEAAGPWLGIANSATNLSALSTGTYGRNRGFSFALFSYGDGSTFLQAKFGWNSSASDAGGVALHFWSDGFVEVYRDGEKIGDGKITGGKTTETKPNRTIRVMILPFRRRELLVLSTQGDGFSVVFEDIDEDEPNPEITPDSKVWFTVVKGATQVQVAPLVFASSGYACSQDQSFLEPPATGEALQEFDNEAWLDSPAPYKIYGEPCYVAGVATTATGSLTTLDGTTAFVPNGTDKSVRVKAALTSDHKGYTPFVYGAHLAYPEIVEDTDDSEAFDITSFVLDASFSCPEDPTGVGLDITVKNPVGLSEDVAKFLQISNRAVQARVGDVVILDGRSQPPRHDYHWNDEAARASLEVNDAFKDLDNYQFSERVPLDGTNFSDAIRFLVERVGIDPGDIDVSSTTFVIPFNTAAVCGDFSSQIEQGETAKDWIVRLFDTYAANWWWGFRPTSTGIKFVARKPADLPDAASVTLYAKHEDAAMLGGKTADEAFDFVYRDYDEEHLEPEANQVRVTGWDPRLQRPIQSYKEDTSSIDPTLAPSDRPDNWLGCIRRNVQADTSLTNQALCNEVCETIYDRVTRARRLCQFTSTLLLDDDGVPLWRGDVVELHPRGLWRINSFGAEFVLEETIETPGELEEDPPVISHELWRHVQYTAEYLGPTEEP